MKATALFLSVVLATGLAFAKDSQNKSDVTVDTSKNPITGTKTVTKTTVTQDKMADGEKQNEVTEKTKYMKDGTVEKTVEAKASSSSTNKKH